ncbi:hypothetical protein C0989_002991 [Termitomyces sp. Mn162]|nr:hypothetical protein C0989_002991 [Termitomyces sp. Mn162]
MGSTASPIIAGLATDAAYPHVQLAKLNAHWLTTETLFDKTTGDFSNERKPELFITQPDSITKSVAYANWLCNNSLIIGVICPAISEAEQKGLRVDGTTKECYNALKSAAQQEGPVKQVSLIQEVLFTYVPVSEALDPVAQ